MKLRRIDAMINCPVYKTHSADISSGKQKIRRSVRSIEKSIFSEDIAEAANKLYACESYDRLNPGCRHCRTFASRHLEPVSESAAGSVA